MILKFFSYGMEKYTGNPEIVFIDGFDRAIVLNCNWKQEVKNGFSCPIDCYTDEITENCKQIQLLKGVELIKVLYIDLKYSVYLMSNEGKTIEHIN